MIPLCHDPMTNEGLAIGEHTVLKLNSLKLKGCPRQALH